MQSQYRALHYSALRGNKTAKFSMFLAPNFLGGVPPEFFDLRYKSQPLSDHVAKSVGDPPRELGDFVAKQKTSGVKLKTSWNCCSGRPKYVTYTGWRLLRRQVQVTSASNKQSIYFLYACTNKHNCTDTNDFHGN